MVQMLPRKFTFSALQQKIVSNPLSTDDQPVFLFLLKDICQFMPVLCLNITGMYAIA